MENFNTVGETVYITSAELGLFNEEATVDAIPYGSEKGNVQFPLTIKSTGKKILLHSKDFSKGLKTLEKTKGKSTLPFKFLNGDKVIVRPAEKIEKTGSGLFIPDVAQSKQNKGTVVQIGDGVYAIQTGQYIPTTIKRGSEVIYANGAGTDFPFDGENLLIMRESDIWGVL